MLLSPNEQTKNENKINNVFNEINGELNSDSPNRQEIADALTRALKVAKQSNEFINQIKVLSTSFAPIIAWLGDMGKEIRSFLNIP